LLAFFFVLFLEMPARADLREGERARLFSSVDENLEHVDMADMIHGRPLVLIVGSCS
jgi:hypothetical protein